MSANEFTVNPTGLPLLEPYIRVRLGSINVYGPSKAWTAASVNSLAGAAASVERACTNTRCESI